jgi:RimJ/RimL family protein N-acetyltransferase
MLRHAFDDLGAERVVWHADIRNSRSQTAIIRLGAAREGVLRHQRRRRDGSWRDTAQFSMISEEWPAARQRLMAWAER